MKCSISIYPNVPDQLPCLTYREEELLSANEYKTEGKSNYQLLNLRYLALNVKKLNLFH